MPSQTVYINKENWENMGLQSPSKIINEALKEFFKKKKVKGGDKK